MTTANLLTLVRVFLVPVFMVVLLAKIPYGGFLAAVVFVLAALTDGLDGWVARKYNEVTKLGKLIDPLADKLLISAALVSLVQMGVVNAAAAMLIIGREFAVTGLRLVAAGEGKDIIVRKTGKAKTVSQSVAIVALLINFPGALYLLWIAVGLTVISGVQYFRSGWPILMGKSN